MATVKQRLEANSFFDAAIVRHGFVDYMRDHELLVSGREPPYADWHRYQFVGCVEVRTVTALKPEHFVQSLPDDFVYSGPDYSYAACEQRPSALASVLVDACG